MIEAANRYFAHHFETLLDADINDIKRLDAEDIRAIGSEAAKRGCKI